MKIKQLIRQLIKEHLITETMQSQKLRDLTQILKKRSANWRGITDKFNIALDQVTDDQVKIVRGPEAKKMLAKNDNLLAFFIWEGESYNYPRGLMGVRLGTKFVRFYDFSKQAKRRPGSYNYKSNTDSSAITGYTPKGGSFETDSGIRRTIGSSGGSGAYFSASDYWLPEVKVYLIDTAEIGGATADLKAVRKGNRDVFYFNDKIKDTNLTRYRQSIAAIRATKDPEFIQEYSGKLTTAKKLVEECVEIFMANPEKFTYDDSPGKLFKYLSSMHSELKYAVEEYRKASDITAGRFDMTASKYKRYFDEAFNNLKTTAERILIKRYSNFVK